MSAKLAIVPLSSCDGCQYNLVNDDFLSFLKEHGIEIAFWPLVGVRDDSSNFDVALIEGSVVSDRDLELLRRARSKSKVLIAMGACALLGGVQSGVSEASSHPRFRLDISKPISHFVKVDYYIRGCPVLVNEVVSLLKQLIEGKLVKVGEKRFSYVERATFNIEDSLLKIDSSKCVVCGRCVEACSRVGAKVLNYTYRGIQTVISTPYQEPFERAGCISCGLCTAYCPVGAISFKTSLEGLLAEVKEGTLTTLYVEPEALASLAESEQLEPEYVISAMRALGFLRVVIYSPLNHINVLENARIISRSPAEKTLLSKLLPETRTEMIQPRVTSDTAYVTQCLAWKRVFPNAITSKELQMLLERLDYRILKPEEPDEILIESDGIRKAIGLENLRRLTLSERVCDKVVFEVCPGGCLLGGGQPTTLNNNVEETLNRRTVILEKVKRSLKAKKKPGLL
ncbi:MAG: 4Fe-4S binding protein [Zestosphaera sp.]